jgi:hypothetical protein
MMLNVALDERIQQVLVELLEHGTDGEQLLLVPLFDFARRDLAAIARGEHEKQVFEERALHAERTCCCFCLELRRGRTGPDRSAGAPDAGLRDRRT